MSFGKDEPRAASSGGAEARPAGGGEDLPDALRRIGVPGRRTRRRHRRRTDRRRRLTGIGMVLLVGVSVLFYRATGASAADGEPDLVPFWGSFTVGCTWDNGCGGGHHGTASPALDFGAPEGTAVLAAGSGVARLHEDQCAGKYIEVWHAGVRKWSRYLHLSSYAVLDGATVQRGQIIGRSGNTGAAGGCSTGAHLHYDELDANRRRVDPGPMQGWSGGTWIAYPAALGSTSWNRVAAFGTNAVRNDYTITSGTPTTLLATTTTRPAAPATTVPAPVVTTAPPHTSTATTAPVPGAPGDGTLFRASDAPNVFVWAGGSPWWVPDPTQLELLGGWGRVAVAGPSMDRLLSAWRWRPLQHRAFVEAGNGQMWWCAGGSPWPVASMEELASLNAVAGTGGWSRLPGGAGAQQWACGGTLPGAVFQRRGGTELFVWTGTGGWARDADGGALRAAGWGGTVNVIPAG